MSHPGQTSLQCNGVPKAVAEDIQRYLQREAPQLAHAALYHASLPKPEAAVALSIGDKTHEGDLCRPISLSSLAHHLKSAAAKDEQAGSPLGLGWRIDSASRRLMHESHSAIALSEKEFALLLALVTIAPQTMSRAALLQEVWAYDANIDTSTLETHIYRLRQKLEKVGLEGHLVTFETGYCWQPA